MNEKKLLKLIQVFTFTSCLWLGVTYNLWFLAIGFMFQTGCIFGSILTNE